VWLVILNQLQLISNSGVIDHLKERFIAEVQGQPIEVDIMEVMAIYLLTTVGVTCESEYGYFFDACGGYLGIKANMCSTMTALITFLEGQRHQASLLSINFSGQLGGDDAILTVVGQDSDECHLFFNRFFRLVNEVAGRTKSSVVTELHPGMEPRVIGSYCKRDVYASICTVEIGISVRLVSVEKLPLLNLFLCPCPQSRLGDEILNVHHTIKALLGKRYDWELIRDAYVYCLKEINGLDAEYEVIRSVFHIHDVLALVHHRNSTYFSPEAYAIVSSYPAIETSTGVAYRMSLDEKVRHGVRIGDIDMKRVHTLLGEILLYVECEAEHDLMTQELVTIPLPEIHYSRFATLLLEQFDRLRNCVSH